MNIFKHLAASLLIVFGGLFAHADTVGQVQFKFLSSGVVDPRVQATEGRKGTVWVLIPAIAGDAVVLVKQDNGVTTNWVPVGTSVASQYISAGTADPTVVAQPGQRGYLYIRTQSGAVGLYQKQGNTSPGTDWVAFGTGGGTPTGNPTSVAIFDSLGDLSSNVDFLYSAGDHALIIRQVATGGSVLAASGGVAFGNATTSGTVGATSTGIVNGNASSSGSLLASGIGSRSSGSVSGGVAQATGSGSSLNIFMQGASSAATASGNGSVVSGVVTNSGTLTASGSGSSARGYADAASSVIRALSNGASSSGAASAGGVIAANGQGAHAIGYATSPSSIIQALGLGSFSSGQVVSGGSITSNDGGQAAGVAQATGTIIAQQGARAEGYATGSGASIAASGSGSQARGHAEGGLIQTSGLGSFASGISFGATLTASGNGSQSFGVADSGAQILTSGDGSLTVGVTSGTNKYIRNLGSGALTGGYAFGPGTSTVEISANAAGSIAFGYVEPSTDDPASIQTLGIGSLALGAVLAPEAAIYGSGNGVLAGGYIGQPNGNIEASGEGSVAWGTVGPDGNLVATNPGAVSFGNSNSTYGYYSATFGQANINTAQNALVIGRYSDPTGTPDTWVATEPVFAIGGGTSIASRANIYQIDKDGRTNAQAQARNSAIRLVTAATALSERTDRVLLVDTSASGGSVTVTLPAGVNGLEFYVRDIGSNASVNNIIFAATGGDTFLGTPDITANNGMRQFIFYNGVWYLISRS